MLYPHGIKIVQIKPFFRLQFQAVTLVLKQTTNITTQHEYYFTCALLDYVSHIQIMYYV